MELGPNERVERKEALRSPAAPAQRDNSAERERSTERRDAGTYRLLPHATKITPAKLFRAILHVPDLSFFRNL